MNKTTIEWCDYTWNPVRARRIGQPGRRSGTFCTRISPGCTHCYASTINKRFGTGLEYTVPNLELHEFFLDDRILAEPVNLKKPSRIFVGDMFDLFHEQIPVGFIAEVLRVAMKTPRHTFQFLTKRAERMRVIVNNAQAHWGVEFGQHMWFGVSVENQPRAEERITQLLRTRYAVGFLSVEPQLENINLISLDGGGGYRYNALASRVPFGHYEAISGVDWVICGGESGPGARPFNLAWAESLLAQCRRAGVPFFMKQLGSNSFCQDCADQSTHFCGHHKPKDRKGGDPAEWPAHLRVREFPALEVPA